MTGYQRFQVRMRKIVIVGGGQAAASLAIKLRGEHFKGSIDIVCKEPHPPYQRPPLSKKYLLGELSIDRLYLRPKNFYLENNISLYLGKEVTQIDRENKRIYFNGGVLDYDDLALTIGSQPRLLPEDIGGQLGKVFAIRDLADVDRLAPEFKSGQRLLVIGGGYIGLEAAAVAAQKGLNVTLVEMAERILQRVAAPQTAAYFRMLHQSHCVDVKEGVGLKRLKGKNAEVSSAVLSDGTELDVDFAIVGVGIYPVTDIAEAAGLVCSNGIEVDQMGKTSDPAIWAAGDCCSFPFNGGRLRLESVPHAIDQAEIIAQNILGARLLYNPKPWFWSDQYDVKLQITGLSEGFNQVIARQTNAKSVSFWYYKDDRLIAVDAMNDPRSYMVGKRLIEAGKTASAKCITDLSFDLKNLLRT